MGTAQLGAVRRMFDRVRDDAGDGDGDGALLARYRAGRDDDAFGALVKRHGPMVLGVCRRVLRDPHAAADAFQVTFLVLARRAGAVRPPGVLGAWLYGVAVRTALKARGREVRRREVEADYAARPRPEPPPADAEVLRLIDAQLAELPEKYRLPLVLCGVQGLGKAEAADRLALPEGTVSSRLARARALLRGRLERRGVAVPAAALLALTPATLRAAVPPALLSSAVKTAVGAAPVSAPVLALSQEVLAAMTAPAWKLPAAVVAAFAISAGAVGLSGAQQPGTPDKAPAAKQKDKPAARPAGARTAGTLGAADAAAGTITLTRKNEADLVVAVAKDAVVTADGKAAKLGDLKAGAQVEVERAGDKAPATKVAVTGRRVTAPLVGVGDNTVSLKGKPNDQDFTLAAGAKVTRDGKEAKLAELPVGEPVTVQLTADGSAALAVSSGEGKGRKPQQVAPDEGEDFAAPQDGEKRPARVARQTGAVAAVDAAAGTITLSRKGDGGDLRYSIPVAKDATVVVDGKAANLADVKAQGVAQVERPREGQPATKITITGEKLVGFVADLGKTSITVGKQAEGQVVTRKLALAPNMVVTLDGKAAKLTDLQTADRVTVTLTTDGTAALAVVAGVPKRDGEPRPAPKDGEKREPRPGRQTGAVGAVDAAAGTITLVRKGDGGERRDTVAVAKDAAVTVDGKAAKLADVKAGVAEVEVPGEGKAATKVSVTGERVTGLLKSASKTEVVVIGRGNEGNPPERRFALAPNATITLGGKAAAVADLQPADQVTVTLTSDGTAALVVTVGQPPRTEGNRPRAKDSNRE